MLPLIKRPRPRRDMKKSFLKTAYQRKHMKKSTKFKLKSEQDQTNLSEYK